MIKHIVIFTFKSFECHAERHGAIQEIKNELEALLGVVPSLKGIEVGINCNPKEGNDLVLTTLFDDMAGLNAYAVHPAHQAVASKIGAIKIARACVDYEM